MKRAVVVGISLTVVGIGIAAPISYRLVRQHAQPGWSQNERRFTLPNGWRLTPAGRSIELPGDMPGNILVINDGKQAIVNTSGFHDHSINVIDLESGALLHTLGFKKSWFGLAATSDGFWVSGGQTDAPGNAIHKVSLTNDGLTESGGVTLPGKESKAQFVSGITTGRQGVYVLDIQHDTLFLIDADGKTRQAHTGYRPYTSVLSPDGRTLAVSNWGDKSVTFFDAQTLSVESTVAVQSLPCALSYSADGRLFVANSGSNSVSVIQDGKVIETIRTSLNRDVRVGSSPSALTLSPDSRTLFVANSDNNCVAVIDVAKSGSSRVEGFIPTERYPSAIAMTPDGKKLLVATAKGYYGPNAGKNFKLEGKTRGADMKNEFKYIGDQLSGRLSIIGVPDAKQLAAYTKLCYENLPLGDQQISDAGTLRAIQRGAFSKIKHVIYIIKENRTYDQEFGDIPKGNGDPSLTLFGAKVTPNAHKIVNSFALFDNLYTDGEVSQSGHQWTDAAYADDYNEKQWILSYSRHGEIESDKRLTSSPGDYIWSAARKKGLNARVYGEYVDIQEDHDSLHDPKVKADPEKFGYSGTFEKIFARGGRDVEKVEDFLREMHQAEKSGNWPNLMVMALPEDHTHGMSAGEFSPQAMVADNDKAIGMLIDAVSHSKFWSSTAIFMIQDDAQSGPDHVDSHRTIGMVVSPYIRRGIVDSTMYSTASMLRTMELMLGLEPLSQYDAHATPMANAFTTEPDLTPYSLAAAQVDLEERNPAKTALARRSAKLDFSDVDRADWNELNRILWEAYKPGVPYPAPVHGR